MRCIICDYCDSNPKSVYNFSVIDPKGHGDRIVFYDKNRNEEICNYCYEPPVEGEKQEEKGSFIDGVWYDIPTED